MKFPVCPNCNGEWNCTRSYCSQCDLHRCEMVISDIDYITKFVGEYCIQWFRQVECVVYDVSAPSKIISHTTMFPFDITEERLEKMLVLL